ncbi:hypothetical protein Q8W37_13365 [Shimia thalassica]|jgi:hypothetical protein|uniref:hypothetical protein n=1 Tax=Shimia thalassica TaxID=1715693 RepID=UPI001C08F152|nr:hypothetical protein [Shimia thalassica]MBU2943034.1 hypothetical protein [Shimia thalassica]MDO6479100.1 hypothetical protein [Shimia thalassica]MDO6482143.1 hypothetical protein [Shimia thalassica]MDO6502643.1 hypothetical protein [Shimia thalassica]MDP2519129.1 hypothetical protein [Shimia thalassica]
MKILENLRLGALSLAIVLGIAAEGHAAFDTLAAHHFVQNDQGVAACVDAKTS